MAIALNSDNDMFAEDGKIKRVYDGAQVVQHVRSRLLHYLGEWFLDTLAGVDYFGKIFVKPADLAETEAELKTTILETPGFNTLDTFEMAFDNTTRLLTVSWTGTTTAGDAIGATVNTSP